MALQFYLDEDVPHDLAGALRTIGYDALSVKDVGNFRLTDPRQLFWAVDHGRTLITYNGKDFRLLHEGLSLWSARWNLGSALRHSGILILPHLPTVALADVISDFARPWDSIDNRLFVWDERRGWHEPL